MKGILALAVLASTALAIGGHKHSKPCMAAEDKFYAIFTSCKVEDAKFFKTPSFVNDQSVCMCSVTNDVIFKSTLEGCTGPTAGKDDAHIAQDVAVVQKACLAFVSPVVSGTEAPVAAVASVTIAAPVATSSRTKSAASSVIPVASVIVSTAASAKSGSITIYYSVVGIAIITMFL
ncbi:hypothetical protein BCR33DRAFT_497338 [Rhizoclosmatium globosum]|uniref:Extracellular membrane protein CFEM domain-containing protein n=1 Tax=Rhizoclosmatium globosum TaxID=329046 RepID=A0A1Y2CV27_9FUNG|nr:hypothetical protein BCR33DRAFT_497338 [Rhizoclosmatium globosum]|eukprot:ORY50872.1 hypothetical protein BCR33DRAFT_497338 [Rhizoclosmatium globosum]